MVNVTNNPTVSAGFSNVTQDLVNLNNDVNAASGGSKEVNVLDIAMKLGMLMMQAGEKKLANTLKEATGRLNQLTAMNKLKEDVTALRAIRTNAGTAEGKAMTTNSADTTNFIANAERAGITVSAQEKANWQSGNVTAADIDTLDARIKTLQDSATNGSQADQMNMQKYTTQITQFTNMTMSFLDKKKEAGDRIFR
jgi:hypothetical protein